MASKITSSPNRNSPSSPKASSSSAPPSQAALKLAYTLGSVFLPSAVDIIRIGEILGEGEAPEWNDKVKRLDMYSETPYVLLAEAFPTIKLKNTYLVWTPRRVSKKGCGIDRDLKSPKGGYWYAGGGKIPVMDGEKVIGYFRVLKFYEGGKGGRGGDVTDWCMTEFFVSEGVGNDFVICTVVFENLENRNFLKAFDEASSVLEKNATSARGTKLETNRAVSKGGKRAPQAKAKESVVGSVGSAIDVGTQIAPVARRTRSQSIKLAEASGSGSLKSHDSVTTRSKKRGGTLGTVKASTRDASTPFVAPDPNPERVAPPRVVQVPVQAPEVAPHVETDVERKVSRELGLSAAERESMEDKEYYNLVRPTDDLEL